MKTDMELRQERDAHRKAARKVNKILRQRSRKAHGLPQRKKGMGCRIGELDVAATKARKFLDPASFVRTDGSEVCKGRDWRVRTGELRERSGGRCEYTMNLAHPFFPVNAPENARCAKAATIPAHVEPRHPKRDDRMSNLKHYCFEHDRETEKQGWRVIRSGKVGA